MLRFEKVSKIYDGGMAAVAEVSLEVQAGETLALIGPSGCGKTTLLKMVNRLVEKTGGRILVDGRDVAQWDPIQLRRSIGYVIQQIGLLPHLTVEKNLGYVLKIMGRPPSQCRQRAEELLELVGLPLELLKRYPGELSGGQQQRIGVPRALAADPRMILMDEPFGAIDQITRNQLQDELLRLQARLAKTMILVTHDIQEAIKLADRIAIMREGRLEQVGTFKELLASPANDFVELFLQANCPYDSRSSHRQKRASGKVQPVRIVK